MKTMSHLATTILAMSILLRLPVASATTVAGLRKQLTPTQQATYVTGAVSMLAYSYAADGHRPNASCVMNWYFTVNTPGGTISPRGPRDLADSLGRAEATDPEKYQVEAFIVDLTDKACGVPPTITRIRFQNDPQQDLLDDISDLRNVLQGQHGRAVAQERDAGQALEESRRNAIVLSDGRRVYFTRDGTKLYGEDDKEITNAAAINEARRLLAARPGVPVSSQTTSASPATPPAGQRPAAPGGKLQNPSIVVTSDLQKPPTIAGPPLSLKNFRKTSPSDQSLYVSGAVAMLAYSYAASNERDRSRCITKWYFGSTATPERAGPRDLATEFGVVNDSDAPKYYVEGVILGVTDKVCGAGASQGKPKP